VDGAKALAAVLASEGSPSFDIILMDLMMPVMGGLESCVRIRAAEQRCGAHAQRAWIVALTANAADEERRECFAAGMNDFVTKPFHPEAMRGVLRRYEARQHGGDAPSRLGGDGAQQRTDSWRRTAAVVLAARNSSRTSSLDMSVEVR
jgi:protein-histidine pros-kinase